MQKRRTSKSLGLLVSLVLLLIVATALWQWQAIFDWWRLRGYQASPEIVELARTTTMTSKAERLFFIFHPELNDKETFNYHCSNREHTIVLGCYVVNQGIYLYDIQDPRLQGVKQVTAAHEMLHVAYQRLSGSERRYVNQLLEEAYAQVTDERIRANVESYRVAGDDVLNELHSILGTEVASLPPALEEYYAQYFTDRARVVAHAHAYEQEFRLREQQVADYDAQLAGLKIQIESNEVTLEYQLAEIEAQKARLDTQLRANDYAGYNAGVPSYNAAVRSYNALIQTTRGQIEQYNQIVEQRNQIALEEQQLIEALDSRLPPQPTH